MVTSGTSFMSDSWIAWKPRIDDPSNMRPSVKEDSSNCSTGMLKCCITPGRSMKRTSMNSTPSRRVKAMASSAFVNMHALLAWMVPFGRGRRTVPKDGRGGLVLTARRPRP